jgi:hypothetical protein
MGGGVPVQGDVYCSPLSFRRSAHSRLILDSFFFPQIHWKIHGPELGRVPGPLSSGRITFSGTVDFVTRAYAPLIPPPEVLLK